MANVDLFILLTSGQDCEILTSSVLQTETNFNHYISGSYFPTCPTESESKWCRTSPVCEADFGLALLTLR